MEVILEIYELVKSVPFDKIEVGEMGAQMKDIYLEVDGDKQMVNVYKITYKKLKLPIGKRKRIGTKDLWVEIG